MNISQAQLAQRLYISPQAVGKWERGESMPDIITLNRLAEILHVDLNHFSNNFQSNVTEEKLLDTLTEPSEELSTGKQKKKLSWDMSGGSWVDADFSGLKNLHEKFSSSNMQGCKFIGSDLSKLLLKNNNVDSCDFSNSNISSSHIQVSNLLNNIFKDCSLKEAEFSGSFIKGCDFSKADFKGTTFSKSYVENCNLSGANFNGTEFSKSFIKDSDFSNADFTGVNVQSGGFEKNTMTDALLNNTAFNGVAISDVVFNGTVKNCAFENCVFTRVTFLNSTLVNTFFKTGAFFKSKSLKGIRFTDCKADRMTYEFLKSGKADLTGITINDEGGNK